MIYLEICFNYKYLLKYGYKKHLKKKKKKLEKSIESKKWFMDKFVSTKQKTTKKFGWTYNK